MRVKTACTLESWTAAPKTHCMTFATNTPLRAISQTLKATRKAYPNSQWRSLVIVIEKVDADTDTPPVEASAPTAV